MHRVVLHNGLTVIWHQRPSKTITLEICVRVGSNHESSTLRGISHFIEHMVFEGTKKRPNAMLISNEIERIGGEFNAATTFERTLYYATVAQKHFDIALDVLSDMMVHPLFDPVLIEKERKVILDEIKVVTDDPRNHQWVLFHQALFKHHPSRNPVYGSVATVKNIQRKHLLEFFHHYYTPQNMMVVIVGGGKDLIHKVETVFDSIPSQTRSRLLLREPFSEPPLTRAVVKKEKKTLLHSYVVYGYRTVLRDHPQSYVIDVIRAHLGRGQSGTLFNEIRTKLGLAYDVGVYHNASLDYGYMAVYFSTDKMNIKNILSMIDKELQALTKLEPEQLRDAKTFIEGDFLLQNEDNAHCADTLAAWETIKGVEGFSQYLSKINKVTLKDVALVARQYFSQPSACGIIEQK